MNKYELLVRGEIVRIEFERINDSRRLDHYKFGTTQKKPNLFGVRAVMHCQVTLPIALCPDWVKKGSYQYTEFPFKGMAFCSRKDLWSSLKGRHTALSDALTYSSAEPALNAEIVDAFTLAESARAKVKGPARMPKTAKPKPRRPSKRQSTFERIADALEKIVGAVNVRPADTVHIETVDDILAELAARQE
jgi:hypothetical protein